MLHKRHRQHGLNRSIVPMYCVLILGLLLASCVGNVIRRGTSLAVARTSVKIMVRTFHGFQVRCIDLNFLPLHNFVFVCVVDTLGLWQDRLPTHTLMVSVRLVAKNLKRATVKNKQKLCYVDCFFG